MSCWAANMYVPQDGDPWPSPFDLMAPVNGAIFFIYLPGRDWRRSHSPEGAVACTISSRSVVRCQARPVPTNGSRGQANRVELRVNSPGFWHQAFGTRSLAAGLWTACICGTVPCCAFIVSLISIKFPHCQNQLLACDEFVTAIAAAECRSK